jgi:uncharacterized membrane protein YhaH (DUF805 family)
VIVIALLAGYACFAAFVATRLVSVAAVLGVLYLLLVLTNAFFAERRARDARRSGPSAGITFLYAGLGVMLAGLLVAIGPW